MSKNICKTCFLPEDFPSGSFQDNSCSFCSANYSKKDAYKMHTTSNIEEMKKDFSKLLANYDGKYDCIIGCSGGLDSSYNLYVAKTILNLNPLVVSYDHGFTYEFPKNNIKVMCDKLGVDYIFLKSKRNFDYGYIKNMIKALKPLDTFWGICYFCHYILPTSTYKVAMQHKIPILLVSDNHYEELKVPIKPKIKAVLNALLSVNVINYPTMIYHLIIAIYFLLRLKMEFYIPPFTNVFSKSPAKPKDITFINVTKYVEWDIDKMLPSLYEIGWKNPEDVELPMRFDCKIEEGFVNHTWKKHFGVTIHEIICSNLIQENVRKKSDLQSTVDYYNLKIMKMRDEVFKKLKIK